MLRCPPCGKTFTGQECYDQHMKSEKHKKKVLSSGLLNNQHVASLNLTDTNTVTESKCDKIKCSICDILFDSVESFQRHSETPQHALKIMLKNTEVNISNSVVSSSTSSSNDHELNIKDESISTDEDEVILPEFENYKNFQQPSFTKCDVCNKSFSGPEPYKQHLESGNHIKKVELEKQPTFSGININTFSCEPCKKTFSGQVPYVQHMSSEVHRRKLQQIQAVQKFLSEGNSSPRKEENDVEVKQSENTNPWFCKICNVQCSGLVPYQQHTSGSTHFKNMKRAQPLQINFNLEDPVEPVVQGNDNENRIPVKSGNVLQLVDGNNKKNDQMKSDHILPGLVDEFNIMSSDELADSIKIFLPHENIDFDKEESKMQTDSEKKNVSKDNSEQNLGIAKEKSDVYQVCNLCDIQLFDKDEAALHYESLEHVRKRWGSDFA